jgi:hypothetical protein
VSLFVQFMLRRGCESSIAEGTSKGFVSTVNTFVLLQIAVLTESFTTVLTFERLVT